MKRDAAQILKEALALPGEARAAVPRTDETPRCAFGRVDRAVDLISERPEAGSPYIGNSRIQGWLDMSATCTQPDHISAGKGCPHQPGGTVDCHAGRSTVEIERYWPSEDSFGSNPPLGGIRSARANGGHSGPSPIVAYRAG